MNMGKSNFHFIGSGGVWWSGTGVGSVGFIGGYGGGVVVSTASGKVRPIPVAKKII